MFYPRNLQIRKGYCIKILQKILTLLLQTYRRDNFKPFCYAERKPGILNSLRKGSNLFQLFSNILENFFRESKTIERYISQNRLIYQYLRVQR